MQSIQPIQNTEQDECCTSDSILQELREAPSGYAQLVYRKQGGGKEIDSIIGHCFILEDESTVKIKSKVSARINEESVWLNHLMRRAHALS